MNPIIQLILQDVPIIITAFNAALSAIVSAVSKLSDPNITPAQVQLTTDNMNAKVADAIDALTLHTDHVNIIVSSTPPQHMVTLVNTPPTK